MPSRRSPLLVAAVGVVVLSLTACAGQTPADPGMPSDEPQTLTVYSGRDAELIDPLVPDELYNDCITNSHNPEARIQIVQRLPTINRRVVLFVISFLQLFLEDKIQTVTKMTSANLALVMAPNLLRCNSESMVVVFTNSQ